MPASCPASSCWRAWCVTDCCCRAGLLNSKLSSRQDIGIRRSLVLLIGRLLVCCLFVFVGYGQVGLLPSGSHAGLAFWASSLHGRAAPDMCLLLTLLPISAVEA